MHISKKKVLIIVAHPDDESFGCGGLIKKLIKKKNEIFAISFTNGLGSRNKTSNKKIIDRKKASIEASKILGFKWLAQYDFPDNELNKINFLEIIKKIEIFKKKINPHIVLTHNFTDLNIDHRLVAEATLTAFRPEPKHHIEEFITFEVPSATDYRILKSQKNFLPNCFFNIQDELKFKIKAIKAYKNEVKIAPHSRSLDGIKNLSKLRGNQSGLKNAEAYEIIRKIYKN